MTNDKIEETIDRLIKAYLKHIEWGRLDVAKGIFKEIKYWRGELQITR